MVYEWLIGMNLKISGHDLWKGKILAFTLAN
jgi:hypothetical protein